jgi:Cu+-exporting ATPase
MITGEPVPVPKKPGDRVTGATINGKGSLVIRAERVGSDTLLSQIVHIRGVQSRPGTYFPRSRICRNFVFVLLWP